MARNAQLLGVRDARRPFRCRPSRTSLSRRGGARTLGELIAAVYDAAGPGASAGDVVRLLGVLQARAARVGGGVPAHSAC